MSSHWIEEIALPQLLVEQPLEEMALPQLLVEQPLEEIALPHLLVEQEGLVGLEELALLAG